jgi:hypothetical protein
MKEIIDPPFAASQSIKIAPTLRKEPWQIVCVLLIVDFFLRLEGID